MPSIYELKPKFQHLLSGTVGALARRGVTANQVTLCAAILSIAYGALLFFFQHILWLWAGLAVFLFVRMALNAIDGMLARQFNQKSPLGGLLNEVGDVVSDAALFLPFALLAEVQVSLLILVVFLAIVSEYIGVCAVMIGASRRYDGPMGKSDRAFIFGAMGLAIGCGISAGIWLNIILLILTVLLLITIINRGRHALKELS